MTAGPAAPRLPDSVAERTVPQLLQAAVEAAPDRRALIAHSLIAGGEITLTYRELADRARRFAAVLRDRGVGRGDRVAIVFGNDGAIEAHTAYHAAHHLGAISVPINTFYVGREFEYAMSFIDPAAVVFAPQFAGVIEDSLKDGASPALHRGGRGARARSAVRRAARGGDGAGAGSGRDRDRRGGLDLHVRHDGASEGRRLLARQLRGVRARGALGMGPRRRERLPELRAVLHEHRLPHEHAAVPGRRSAPT